MHVLIWPCGRSRFARWDTSCKGDWLDLCERCWYHYTSNVYRDLHTLERGKPNRERSYRMLETSSRPRACERATLGTMDVLIRGERVTTVRV
jgi:hypothetical protein